MTRTTPEFLTFFGKREIKAHDVYMDCLGDLVDNYSDAGWHEARELRFARDYATALLDAATHACLTGPCTHTLPERSHEAQRCSWCWMMTTYSRLSTPKENEDG